MQSILYISADSRPIFGPDEKLSLPLSLDPLRLDVSGVDWIRTLRASDATDVAFPRLTASVAKLTAAGARHVIAAAFPDGFLAAGRAGADEGSRHRLFRSQADSRLVVTLDFVANVTVIHVRLPIDAAKVAGLAFALKAHELENRSGNQADEAAGRTRMQFPVLDLTEYFVQRNQQLLLLQTFQ